MILQFHFQAFAESQRGFWTDWETEFFGQLLPVTIAHAWISQTLDQWNVRLEILQQTLDLCGHLRNACKPTNITFQPKVTIQNASSSLFSQNTMSLPGMSANIFTDLCIVL